MDPSSICAVFVTYRPGKDVLANIAKVTKQGVHVTVVDNSPEGESFPNLAGTEELEVICNGRNLGIAAALNIGIRAAMSRGCSWVVLFDQDSRISEGFIEAMLASYKEAGKSSRAGILFPRYRDAGLKTFLYTHRDVNGDAFACMTSGSMIHRDTLQILGLMEEALFIDYVDIEFCLRARSAGLKVIECQDAVLEHSLGHMTSHRLLWRTFTTTNHNARRRYYITRNRLVLIRRYFSKDREWAIADLKGIIAESIKICLVESDKLRKCAYMLRAAVDALRGRLGPRVKL